MLVKARSIRSFCDDVGISIPTFYRHRGEMPKTIKVGRQVRILESDEADWQSRLQSKAAGDQA